ncbi:glycosyltransferase family 39 protein [Nonomuraea sp. NPDC050536]|uniref:glycosyltransferase family 39 protein n=1 Tax=Nonomuraea sp. NPDC050536 TaxID=3364366 RepID=UPI0037C73DD5
MLVAAAVACWGLATPSLWRDESVSVSAARMPLSQLRLLLGDIDAVHALYYLLLRPFITLPLPVEAAARLPSVLAFAGAALGVTVIGRRLAGPLAGLAGGLIYAVTPIAVRYAQEARSYALVSAVAVLATWLLLRLADRPARWPYVAYAASLALLGYLHLYAMLLLPAHAVAAWFSGRRWALVPMAAAGLALVPLALVASGQREAQVFWLKKPDWSDVASFPVEVAGSVPAAIVLFALAAWGVRRAWPVALCAVLPVALSFAISQLQPIYHPRYVLFAVPALALLAGVGAASLLRAWWPAVPAVTVFAVLTYGTQQAIRLPDSRPDDLRTLAATLEAGERPGDAVLFVPQRYRLFVAAYSRPYDRLVDLTHAPGDYQPRTADQLRRELSGIERVWLVSPRIAWKYAEDERLVTLRETFRKGQVRMFGSIHLTLYTRKN